MNAQFNNAAKAAIAPKVMKNFKWSWLAYGAAAYFGLKYLNKKGILTKQTGAALNLINQGVDLAKDQMGLSQAPDKMGRVESKDSEPNQVRH